ncbi:MAG: hypothetical protein JNK46_07120 [Methylobacteriaceae bacterium]|nr:hypothetical protein [Methylobacteriaceae bacterium]
MKIADIKTFPCDGAFRDLVFVKVETDPGLYGWREAGGLGHERACEATVREIKTSCMGRDPGQIEPLWNTVYRALGSPWKPSPVMQPTATVPAGWRRPW